MSTSTRVSAALRLPAALAATLLVLTGCGSATDGSSDGSSGKPTLRISSIPDQDPDQLATRDGAMATYLSKKLDVNVEYVPVTDYAASVNLFHSGDLDMVFYGGLTGVQARKQTPGSVLIAQRDVDVGFRTVFIAHKKSGIKPVKNVAGLTAYQGKRFTFGSENSTSGRLMPQYFLDRAGVGPDGFAGKPGYSGSHDKTIKLVESGAYQGGALNEEVWKSRLADGSVDTSKVVPVFITPRYHDYHWLAGPQTDKRFGTGFTNKIKAAMLGLKTSDPEQAKVLKLYTAGSFVATKASNYAQIEQIATKLKLLG